MAGQVFCHQYKRFLMAELKGYDLSRDWFNWCFENPELIRPSHSAMYFFIIEHCNRLGWKPKFGLPTQMTMDAIGISNYKTFAKTFKNLQDWGFIQLLQPSKNQYSTNVIALVKNTKACTKAYTKASLKHVPKQVQSIVDINKPINLEPINQESKAEILHTPENPLKNSNLFREPKIPDLDTVFFSI
jgi:hypothetical protein